MRLLALVTGFCVLTVACGDDSGSETYEARIVRTEFGIPHVTATNFGSLGFGNGYAYAEDNFCVLMKEIVRANGQSARYFGEDEGSVNQDFLYTFINTDEYIEGQFRDSQTEDLQSALRGYAAGINKYLQDTGVDNLPEGDEGCRGADWVREIADTDVYRVYRKLLVRAGHGPLARFIVAAEAPTEAMASLAPPLALESLPFDRSDFGLPTTEEMGSNMYAIGSEASQTGYGILLGNPHFPWSGPLRWSIAHLTIPGEFDIMGAALQGIAIVAIGFNANVAWSHTVSTGERFTLYEVTLVENDPMKYIYDDEERDILANEVTIQVKLEDGTIEERTEVIYSTHFGPVIDLTPISEAVGGWPTLAGTLMTFRDANIDNTRAIDQFFAMNKAQSVDELQAALGTFVALPWVNTTATDRDGNAFYGDVTTVPHVTVEKLEDCDDSPYATLISSLAGLTTLNGSRSDCEWGSDEDAPVPGLFGPGNLPQLRNRTYVANSNDSYWLSNPDEPLEGFSPLIGRERVEQSMRTRQAFLQAEERLAGTDGLGDPGFTVELVQELMFGNRNITEEMTRTDVLTICDGVGDWSEGACPTDDGDVAYSQNPTDAATACTILRSWDGRFNNDSVGASIWNEFWPRFCRGRGPCAEDVWAVPFDADDPVNTPRMLNVADPNVVETVKCALGAGVDFLVDGGIPLDRPWGQVQFRRAGDTDIPIHGGGDLFMFNAVDTSFVEGEGYTQFDNGASYIQTVTFDETECPDAYALLSYSLSSDPASDHYSDMTEELYSPKVWRRMPFCPEDVEAAKISEIVVTNP
ncbi:MAG: penicillin acylase family protein [Myxococcales bacterium]|nr:penicillin acylase family protein [Myxococcales bacterium]MDH3842675.1 penicillin acylase family protein [Myxococcales bacterium]